MNHVIQKVYFEVFTQGKRKPKLIHKCSWQLYLLKPPEGKKSECLSVGELMIAMVYSFSGTLLSDKKQTTDTHSNMDVSKVSCAEEAKRYRVYRVCFHLYETLEETNLICSVREHIIGCLGLTLSQPLMVQWGTRDELDQSC